MKNKIELKKTIIIILCVIVLATILFGAFYYYQYKTYTTNFNDKIGKIITTVTEKYPEINQNELFEIINGEGNVNTTLFNTYGIYLNEDSAIIQNQTNFNKFLILNMSFIIIFSIIILFIFLMYNKLKGRKLNEITRYIEQINNKNYKLDIDDNSEDELSILKNEIYKTTIMLKEVAENSKKDKITLKDSLSDISHQLKTPLTSITILIDNIIDNPEMDNETRIQFAKDIKRKIVNINFLVSSLLKLSKLDANSVKFVNEDIHIHTIIEESIKNVAVLADLKNVEIKVDGNKEARVYCDFKWQVEAVTNILKNAIEHSNIDSVVEISYEQNNIYSKIEIIDYGIGIDKDDLPHVFERFYKGKNSSSESIGIGLALSKSIIENNNGYVGVESELGEGTRFIIKYLN